MTVATLYFDWAWKLRRDGDLWRATGPGSVDAGISPCGYGPTQAEAVAQLAKRRPDGPDVPDVNMFRKYPDVPWIELEGGKWARGGGRSLALRARLNASECPATGESLQGVQFSKSSLH